ncbi:MAG: hypothetical protein WCT32_01435 [Patescibacteria group bacterium]
MRRVVLVLLLAVVAPIVAYAGPDLFHLLHYRKVEAEGNLRASVISLTVPTIVEAGKPFRCKIIVKNMGSDDWRKEEHYVALGVFDRFLLSRELSDFCFIGGKNRLVVPECPICSGKSWEITFDLLSPSKPGQYDLNLQMVKEGVTWFGEETKLSIVVEKP